MRKSSLVFLQVVVVLIAIGVLFLLLWFPHIEGRNAQATNFEIYFKDPFLAFAYLGSLSIFIGLYKAFRILGYTRQNKAFTSETIKAFRTIKYCAIVLIGFVVVGEVFIFLNSGSDDRAGGVMLGVLIAFGSVITATAAAVFERLLQNAVDIKSENDLTV